MPPGDIRYGWRRLGAPQEATHGQSRSVAGQAARAERMPGNERDPLARAVLQHGIPMAIRDVVLILHGHDREEPAGAIDLRRVNLRETDMAHEAVGAQIAENPELLVFRNRGINAVQLIEIEA